MTTTDTGAFVDVQGTRTHFHDVGTGPAVVLLHGSGPGVSAWSNWRGTIEFLQRDFRVVAPDIVGFGDTERKPGQHYGLETYIAHVLAFLDAVGVQRAHLIGNSMGGRISLTIASRHPELVDRLVLMGSLGPAAVPSDGLKAVRAYTPGLEHMRELLRTYFAYDPAVATEEMIRQRYEASARPEVSETYPQLFANPQDNALPLAADDVRRIACETLVIHGRDDRVILFENALALFELLPNVQLHGLSRCGHWVQLEQREVFERLVTDFFHSPAHNFAR